MTSSTSVISTSVTMNEFPMTLRAVREGCVGESVILCLTGEGREERLTISRKEYESLGAPAVGTVMTAEVLAAARRMADYRATLATALHILECGDTTSALLGDKLRRRGHTDESVVRVLAEVERRGYINEQRLAMRQVVLCAKKGWGRRRILAYLASRGIDADIVSDAITAAEEAGEVDFTAARRAFIEARRARGMSDAAIRRALWNAGF